jgi:hypothetical protein
MAPELMPALTDKLEEFGAPANDTNPVVARTRGSWLGDTDDVTYLAMCALTFAYCDFDVKLTGRTSYPVRWEQQLSAFPPRPMDFYVKAELRFRIMRVVENTAILTPSQRKWAKFALDYLDGTTNITWSFERSFMIVKPSDVVTGSEPDGVQDLGVVVTEQERKKIEDAPEATDSDKRDMAIPATMDPNVAKVIAMVYNTAKQFATVGWINANGIRQKLRSDMATIRNEVFTALVTGLRRPERLSEVGTIMDWSIAWKELTERARTEGVDNDVLDAALEAAKANIFYKPSTGMTDTNEQSYLPFGAREEIETQIMAEQFVAPDTLIQQIFLMATLGEARPLSVSEIREARVDEKTDKRIRTVERIEDLITGETNPPVKGRKGKKIKKRPNDPKVIVAPYERKEISVDSARNIELTYKREEKARWAIAAATAIVNEPSTSSTVDWGSVKLDLTQQMPPIEMGTYARLRNNEDGYYSRHVAVGVASREWLREGYTYVRMWGEKVKVEVRNTINGLALHVLDLAALTKLQPSVVQRISCVLLNVGTKFDPVTGTIMKMREWFHQMPREQRAADWKRARGTIPRVQALLKQAGGDLWERGTITKEYQLHISNKRAVQI